MINPRLLSHFSYVAVGIASLLLAVFVATRVVRVAHSQITPPAYAQEGSTAPATPPSAAPTAAPTMGAQPVDNAGGTANPAVPPLPLSAAPVSGAANIPGEVSFLEPYVFDLREGRRNPFRPPTLSDGTMPDVVLPGTPLERYELNELKLVGIMWDVRTPKAMFLDPTGEVHVLGKDDRIGRKRGYVAVIREGEVVVVETTNFNGENTYATRVVRIDNK